LITPTLLYFAGVPGAAKPAIHDTPDGDADPGVADGPVVGLADEVVVVLVTADLLDELHAPSNAAHARNTTTVRHDRRRSDPTDMNPSSVPDFSNDDPRISASTLSARIGYSGWSPCAVRSRFARV
jgi:hypothetical protein